MSLYAKVPLQELAILQVDLIFHLQLLCVCSQLLKTDSEW